MEYRIRRTRDYHTLIVLNKKIFGEGFEVDFAKHICWVVKDENNTPVGFCSYKKTTDDIVFLSRAGVLPEARGAGLQVRMIRTRLKHARTEGYNCAITYTVRDNPASFTSLQRCGFKLYIPEYEWVGPEQLYWIHYLY